MLVFPPFNSSRSIFRIYDSNYKYLVQVWHKLNLFVIINLFYRIYIGLVSRIKFYDWIMGPQEYYSEKFMVVPGLSV